MNSDALVRIGKRIRYHRAAAGLTQKQLADRVGFARTSVANIEAGRHDPPVTRLLTIANALGVSAADLMEAGDGQTAPRDWARDRLVQVEAENQRLHKRLSVIRAAVGLVEGAS
jgi:transcriptional regulator with XRE-family HTH domain